ncbi:hypothetical protein PVK06_030695 [Gossypium arboreum]|uniref:Zinc knuckle CX2CX4HX4C domain-containing protein n=1 Tax=Gossypium arboreum TaxID=29729 RepID=A0ABR0NP82_GOSAR|nr:hypothetical protein PVK06_030695 [Gossypium arboreum]
MEYDRSSLGKENRNFTRIRAQIDICHPLKRKKQVMFSGKCSYVKFKHEILTLFCFYCGRLGQSDSFCEAKVELGGRNCFDGLGFGLACKIKKSLSNVQCLVKGGWRSCGGH